LAYLVISSGVPNKVSGRSIYDGDNDVKTVFVTASPSASDDGATVGNVMAAICHISDGGTPVKNVAAPASAHQRLRSRCKECQNIKDTAAEEAE